MLVANVDIGARDYWRVDFIQAKTGRYTFKTSWVVRSSYDYRSINLCF